MGVVKKGKSGKVGFLSGQDFFDFEFTIQLQDDDRVDGIECLSGNAEDHTVFTGGNPDVLIAGEEVGIFDLGLQAGNKQFTVGRPIE